MDYRVHIFDMLILLAEDEDDVRGLLYHLLVRHGRDVLIAADGVVALHVLVEHAFDVDVVVMDLDMPRLDGRELTAQLVIRAPHIRVVQMTGGANAQGFSPGVPVLQKPFPLVELLKLLGCHPDVSAVHVLVPRVEQLVRRYLIAQGSTVLS